MKKLTLNHYLLIVILIIASFLRLWKLAEVPNALTPDEASLGYNAYSILKTGRDEYGELLPIIFKSFGDYKPGFYVYLVVPFVATFGLNEWSVRLPSAISGILSVFLIYLIIKKLKNSLEIKNWKLEIAVAFAAATNPWHIFFSRGAWEANASLTLTLLGIYFFQKALTKSYYLLYSSLFFALTLLTYQGGKLSSLIILLVLAAVYKSRLTDINLKYWVKAFFLGLFITLPILLSFGSGQTGRLKVFSVFSYPRPATYLQNFLDQGNEQKGDTKYYLFHTENLNFVRGIIGRWFNHFSGKFLFFEGDYQNPGHSAPNHGMLLLSDLIFIPLGFVFLLKAKSKKLKVFILLWLVLAPLPAVLSRDQVQSVRALNMVIPLTTIIGCGLYFLVTKLAKSKFLTVYLTGIGAIFIISYIYFLDAYFVHAPIHNPKYLAFGYKEAVLKVTSVQANYKRIIFQQSYTQPYIYFLFFQKYDPAKYQAQAVISDGGPDVGFVSRLDNIEFTGFSWPFATGSENTLIIGDDIALPSGFSLDSYTLVSEIKHPDGYKTAFRMVETKEQ